MLATKQYLLVLVIIFSIVLIYRMVSSLGPASSSISSSISVLRSWTDYSNQDYKSECLDLFKKMRNPDASLFFNPPLKEPPKEMYDEFTQYGKMPIKKWYYFNMVYSDSKGGQNKKKRIIKKKDMNHFLNLVKTKQPQPNYGDLVWTFFFSIKNKI